MPNDTRMLRLSSYFAGSNTTAEEQVMLGFYPHWVCVDNMSDAHVYLFDSFASNPIGNGILPFDLIPPHSFKVVPVILDRQNWTVAFDRPPLMSTAMVRLVFTDSLNEATTAQHSTDRSPVYGNNPQLAIQTGSILDTANATFAITKPLILDKLILRVNHKNIDVQFSTGASVFRFPVSSGGTLGYGLTPAELYGTLNGRSYPWNLVYYDTVNNRYVMEVAGPMPLIGGLNILLDNGTGVAVTYEVNLNYHFA